MGLFLSPKEEPGWGAPAETVYAGTALGSSRTKYAPGSNPVRILFSGHPWDSSGGGDEQEKDIAGQTPGTKGSGIGHLLGPISPEP